MMRVIKEARYYYKIKIDKFEFMLFADDENLLSISFDNHFKSQLKKLEAFYNLVKKEILLNKENDIINQAIKDLELYFKGQLKNFQVPCKLIGSAFQVKLWQEMFKVPYGSTISYKQLAKNSFGENYLRAISGAMGKNPLAIIYPCHRIVGSSGSLVGYAAGLDTKKYLLDLEKSNI